MFSLTPPASPGGAWTAAYIHNFTGSWGPSNVVIGAGGVLYGTNQYGGTGPCSFPTPSTPGCGIVYSLTPPAAAGGAWTYTIVYSFGGGDDGSIPSGVVTGPAGVLYGTTYSGGASKYGTVYSLTPPTSPGGVWTHTVLHNFTGGNDGANPRAGLAIGSAGALYGTTYSGGSSNYGTVFSLRP